MKRTVKRRPIPRRATRRKAKQLPHILKHVTFIVICTSIMLLIMSNMFHDFILTIDAIVLLVFCVVVDSLALMLQGEG
jgi:uncharacterized membrane protein YeiH